MYSTKTIHHTALLIMAFVVVSCQTQKQVSKPEEWTKNALWFGTGGGFTGSSTTYCLLENGQLFVKKGLASTTYEALPNIDKKATASAFKKAKALQLPSAEINEPGNMYNEFAYGKNGSAVKLVWSDGNKNIDTKISELHKELFSIIKQ